MTPEMAMGSPPEREVVVRRLSPADAESFVALRHEALETDPGAFGASPDNDMGLDPVFIRDALADPQQAIFGAIESGIIGIVGVYRNKNLKSAHKIHVWGMYVSPTHRSRGIGRSLMEAAIEFARDCDGVKQIHLSVSETALAAMDLYGELGFEAWGTEPRGIRLGQEYLSEHHMVLSLTDD
jgi:ribosomal protein S18 acetylase RimI-like enzyme